MFEVQIGPGNEEKIASPCLRRARAREQNVGESVTNRSKSKLIDGPLFPEQRENFEHTTALLVGVIDPGERRRHERWGQYMRGLLPDDTLSRELDPMPKLVARFELNPG